MVGTKLAAHSFSSSASLADKFLRNDIRKTAAMIRDKTMLSMFIFIAFVSLSKELCYPLLILEFIVIFRLFSCVAYHEKYEYAHA